MHDAERCEICGPIVNTEAYKRGREAALLTIPSTVIDVEVVEEQALPPVTPS